MLYGLLLRVLQVVIRWWVSVTAAATELLAYTYSYHGRLTSSIEWDVSEQGRQQFENRMALFFHCALYILSITRSRFFQMPRAGWFSVIILRHICIVACWRSLSLSRTNFDDFLAVCIYLFLIFMYILTNPSSSRICRRCSAERKGRRTLYD